MTDTMSGGAAMIRAAINNGIDCVFGLPGAQIYPLFDAIHAHGLDLYVPRHEQAAAYMAMGYAKSTGRPAVFCVVPGPGVLNTAAALCTAMGNCSPVVCLTGQVPSEFLGRGRGHLHELPDQAGTLGTFIKRALRIDDALRTSAAVNGAFRTALSGRPGPVAVEMCWDTMARPLAIPIHAAEPLPEPPAPDPDAVRSAARLIERARRPMIMCGAGAQHARDEVLELAELIGAPVTAFRSGRGVVAEDHALGVNPVAARELWDDADLLIGIGSRLEMPYYRWGDPMRYEARPSSGPTLLRIDIDAREMERFVPDLALVGDAKRACRALADALEPRRDAGHAAEIERAKRVAARLFGRIQPQAAYLQVIRDVLPRDGFLVPELSQVGFATYTGVFPVLEPRTYVTEGYQGTLGFGFPTALGVKVAHPDRAVVSIAGDGGFMFAAQELGTAAQYDIGLVTLVFNNGSYANVLRDQQTQFGGRVTGARFTNPDFLELAECFGVAGRRVTSPEALRPVLEASLASGHPALIEVVVTASEASPWPLIHMRSKPSELDL